MWVSICTTLHFAPLLLRASLFWLLSFIYLLLDFLQMGKVLFRILVRANIKRGGSSPPLVGVFFKKIPYLSDYASNGMSLFQIYLDPFSDAFLDGIFGTPGSSKFVVIESVNWKRVLFFQNQFEEKKGKADTGFSPLLSILAKPDMWYLRRNLKDETIL